MTLLQESIQCCQRLDEDCACARARLRMCMWLCTRTSHEPCRECFAVGVHSRNVANLSRVLHKDFLHSTVAIQPRTKALATDSAVMFIRGNAYGQCVNLSTHVRRYLYPWDGGRGPTISAWTTSKRASRGLNDTIVAVVCLITLAHWHWGQTLIQWLLSLFILGQTYRVVMRCLVHQSVIESEESPMRFLYGSWDK